MRTLLQDLRFGARMLLKKPGFTLIAVITLALGIGANTAIFSVVYAVLLRPLPFPEQERLVVAWKRDTTTNNPFVELAVAEVRDWQEQNQSFTSLALMPTTVYGYGYTLTDRGDPVQLESARVTGSFFSILGAQAALGRVFNENDDQVNGAKVVVLSDQLWRERFNADPRIIGQTVMLSQQGFTVIGVMPSTFAFPKGIDLWVPLKTVTPQRSVESRGSVYLQAVGRLKPGVTLDQAEADLNTIIARLAEQYPATEAKGHRVVLTTLPDYLFGDAKPALWALFAATGLLLLIAAANIANLLLTRATSRRKELAVRAAMGASRWRLTGQLLCESFALAICGGAAGVLLAYWLLHLLVAIAPADTPRLEDAHLSGAALIVSVICTLATTVVFGLLPALSASRFNLNETLNDASGKLSGSRAGNRLRGALVVGEVALTIVLLVGATLILRSFVNLSSVNLGFDPANILTMQLRVHGSRYNSPQSIREFYRQLIEQLEARPGVVAASAVLIRPMEGRVGWDTPFALEGQSEAEAQKNRVPNFEVVSPHYFRTFRIPMKTGREFSDQDTDQSQQVAIISETMAKTLFGAGVDPLGKRLKLDFRDSSWMTIVGVAGDVRYRELEDVRFDLYIPFAQSPRAFVNHFAVRTTADPSAMLATVRREVAALDPKLAVSRVATMDELVATHLARPRFSAVLLNWLSGLAVLLSAVGIFGVTAYSVAQRSAEFGVRIALGAQGADILKLVIGQGLRLVAIGIGIGLTASFAATRLISKLLFGVSATDPLTFIVIAALMAVVALLACYIPARRATKVDPMIALRTE
jgi:putative ABC transport system permease protein